jgi:hypothetical protein
VSAPEGPDAFLLSEALEHPYPLHRAHVITLGRGGDNHIVLPVQQVSRLHASIAHVDGAFEITDRGSTNGTLVNDELVPRRRLHERDVIRIGPIEFTFATQIVEQRTRANAGETQHIGLMAPHSFAGALSELGLPDIWQVLELGQKTGRLLVQRSADRGALYFSRGRAVHAELGALRGEEAALALLAMEHGTFRFFPSDSITEATTIRRPAASLLLEAARISDEATRED